MQTPKWVPDVEDSKILRKLSACGSLVLLAAVATVPTTTAQDKLEDTMDLAFNECFPGAPSLEVPDWVGTVDFHGDVLILLLRGRISQPPACVRRAWGWAPEDPRPHSKRRPFEGGRASLAFYPSRARRW